MTDSEINKIVSKILRDRLKEFDFRHSLVHSEQNFDGSSILRITAQLKESEVPSSLLTDALHDVRSKLLSKGEERFVLLGSESSKEEAFEEDVD